MSDWFAPSAARTRRWRAALASILVVPLLFGSGFFVFAGSPASADDLVVDGNLEPEYGSNVADTVYTLDSGGNFFTGRMAVIETDTHYFIGFQQSFDAKSNVYCAQGEPKPEGCTQFFDHLRTSDFISFDWGDVFVPVDILEAVGGGFESCVGCHDGGALSGIDPSAVAGKSAADYNYNVHGWTDTGVSPNFSSTPDHPYIYPSVVEVSLLKSALPSGFDVLDVEIEAHNSPEGDLEPGRFIEMDCLSPNEFKVGQEASLTVTTIEGALPIGGQNVVALLSGVGSIVSVGGTDGDAGQTGTDGTADVVVTSSEPGTSEVRAFWDLNGNGTWDAGAEPLTEPACPIVWTIDPEARISIDPPEGANQVGDPHDLTVTVEKKATSDSDFGPAEDVEVSLTIDDGPGSLSADTCTTDAAGQCTVTLNSSATGLTTVSASADVEVDNQTLSVSTDGDTQAGNSGPAVKRWVDARLGLTPPEDANQVGDTHTFTAHLEFDFGDGAGFVDAPDGETISIAKVSGPGTLSSTSCLTIADGECSVTHTSSTTGLTTVEADWNGQIATAEGNASASASSDEAVKRWVDARIDVTPPEATNIVGDTHTFVAHLEWDLGDGAGFVDAAGETIDWTKTAGPGDLSSTTCDTDADGECTVDLDSDTTGDTTVEAAWTGGIVTAQGTAAASAGPDDGLKHWVDVDARISIDPPEGANRVGDPHDLTVTVEKDGINDDDFVPAPDVEVTVAIDGGPGSLSASTCTTDTSGQCTVTLDSSATGLTTVSASADVDVDGKTLSVATDGQAGNSDPAIKRWVDARLDLTPPEDANQVGDTHTFTAHLEFDHGDGAGFVDAAGETIDLTKLSGPGTLSASSCTTGAAGTCSVDLDSGTTGLTVVEAEWEGTIATTEGTVSADASDEAVKRWVDARIDVTPPEATNIVGDTHTFVAHLEWDLGDGAGFVDAAGETIDWTKTAGPGDLSSTTCDTDADGECTVDLDSDTTGDTTVEAAWTGGIVTAQGTASATAGPDEALKHWVEVDARISIDPSEGANQVGDPHDLTVTVEKKGGSDADFGPAEDVEVSLTIDDGPGSLSADTCTTDAAGQCTVTLDSATTGLTTVSAAADVDVDGKTLSVATDGQAGNSEPAVKRWVDARLGLTPPEDANQVGDTHTFTAHLEFDHGDGAGFVDAPAGRTIEVAKTGGFGTLSASSCTTDVGGTCSVDLTTAITGLTTVVAGWDGGIVTAEGTASASAVSDEAVKRWVDAQLTLTPPQDANHVDDTHTFTAHLTFDRGDGAGFVDAPAGETIALSKLSGPGSLSSDTCLTDGTGRCSIDHTTNATGLTTVQAAWDGEIATAEGNASASASSDEAVKRWVDARLSLTPPTATNIVGDTHTFTADLEWDLGDGAGFVDAPAGETISLSKVSGPGALSAANCLTDAAGQCTVDLDSSETGLTTVGASWAGELVTAEGTVAADASDEATKLWVDALIVINPPEDTNEVGDPHDFTITVHSLSDGVSTPAGGVLVTTEILSGPGAFVGGANTCTTDAAGQCTVTIESSETGLTVVGASATVNVDGLQVPVATDGQGTNVPPAEKRWVDARLALTPPEDANQVGDTHTFVADLDFDLGDGAGFVSAPAGETISLTKVSGPGTLAGSSCVTGGDGTCTIDHVSSETGLTTVTAAWNGLIATTEGQASASASSGEALKRWVDGRLTVTPVGATNVVEDTHTFTALLELDRGDGNGFLPASDEVIGWTQDSGPGTLSADTCTTADAGTCTVDLDSSDAGTTQVTAAWAGDIVVSEGTVSTTFTGAATKDWVDPAIQIVKTAAPEAGPPRDVTYTYLVTNIGDVTLTNVDVTDDILGLIGTIAVLEPGESETLETTVAVDETSPVRNVGTACGDPTVDGEVIGDEVCDDDDATISVVLGETIVRPTQLPRTGAAIRLQTLLAAMLVWLGAMSLAFHDRLRVIRRR